jgi:hypothetical protein
MKEQLADIILNEKHELRGFKVGGLIPFFLTPIRVSTHIALCKTQTQIRAGIGNRDGKLEDFYNLDIMKKATPLILRYCEIGLLNNRPFSFVLQFLLRRKLRSCSHKQLFNLFMTIHKLNEPAFFLAYWTQLTKKEHTISKEEKQSSVESYPTKKRQE